MKTIGTDFRNQATVYAYLPDIGKNNCGSNCDWCFLKTINYTNDEVLGTFNQIKTDLAGEFDIEVIPSDSFSNRYFANNENLGDESAYSIDGEKYAWTSGIPIAGSDFKNKLDAGRTKGYEKIIMNAWGVLGTRIPDDISGYIKTPTLQKAIQNIQNRNQENSSEKPYDIGLTMTLTSLNYSYDSIKTAIENAIGLGVSSLRFNSFINALGKEDEQKYELSKDQTAEFYKNLKQVLEDLKTEYEGNIPLEFSISQDIGGEGADQIKDFIAEDKQENYTYCDAGETLFTLIKENDGTFSLRACVDTMKGKLANVVLDDAGKYTVEWIADDDGILRKNRLAEIRKKDPLANACFSRQDRITPELNEYLNKIS